MDDIYVSVFIVCNICLHVSKLMFKLKYSNQYLFW